MTAAEFIAAGIPLSGKDAVEVLRAEAALDWLKQNTILTFDKADLESINALPASAKLFVIKYGETMRLQGGVSSQSIEGLSQSFDTSTSTGTLIWALANSLLQGYIKSQVRVFPAKRKW